MRYAAEIGGAVEKGLSAPRKCRLLLVCFRVCSEALRNFAKIANSMGVEVEFLDLGNSFDPVGDLLCSEGPTVCDISSLSGVIEQDGWEKLIEDRESGSQCRLFLVSEAAPTVNRIVKILSRGAVSGASCIRSPEQVQFFRAPSRLTAELAGQEFQRDGTDSLALSTVYAADFEPLMGFGQESVSFVLSQSGQCQSFIWSTGCVFDVERELSAEFEFEQALAEIIPAIIFLRAAFGESCWAAPIIGADLIIDDPLLKARYGFIDFKRLLDQAAQHAFHVTVAFIPWNWRRTVPADASFFFKREKQFAICAHGCDHSKDEFLSTDRKDLLSRSCSAAARLELHKERTNMDWTRVMVCPREDFSEVALEAMHASGRFIGLFNTSCIPKLARTNRVRGVDLLAPAQASYGGFPIFKRHYWKDLSPYALASFLGKPVILVEHHGFFKDGGEKLLSIVGQLGRMNPSLRWMDCAEIARRTCRWKRESGNVWSVQFFTDEFLLSNPGPAQRTMKLQRNLAGLVLGVSVDGSPVAFDYSEGVLSLKLVLEPGQEAFIRVERSLDAEAETTRSLLYKCQVAVRRRLSELRDDVLSRSPFALRVANQVLSVLRFRR